MNRPFGVSLKSERPKRSVQIDSIQDCLQFENLWYLQSWIFETLKKLVISKIADLKADFQVAATSNATAMYPKIWSL